MRPCRNVKGFPLKLFREKTKCDLNRELHANTCWALVSVLDRGAKSHITIDLNPLTSNNIDHNNVSNTNLFSECL